MEQPEALEGNGSMPRSMNNPAVHILAVVLAVASVCLLWLGGLVTSHEAGLAVPDWPTTYGYNLFLFPVSRWVGGVFYEHVHRLFASAVGMLTVLLAALLWRREERLWLRWLGLGACLLVGLQGVLGGLRVIALQNWLGLVHAALAQLFLCVAVSLALFTSRWWLATGACGDALATLIKARTTAAAIACLVFVQLMLGATMRHQHSAVAVPTFPQAYDARFWPALDATSLARYQSHWGDPAHRPVTAMQIRLHLMHRYLAVGVLAGVFASALWNVRQLKANPGIVRLSLGACLMAGAEIVLGAWVVWSRKQPDITTAHMMIGDAIFAAQVLLALVCARQVDRNKVASAEVACPVGILQESKL
jgi:heme a synthase